MTYKIKKQQTIDQQILESDIEDPTKFSLNQEYNFAKNDLSNKTDEHESDNRLQNSSDHDSDDSSTDGNQTPYTESSDWDSNSSCSSDYSCFSEDGSLLMDLEIPLTTNESNLIGEFCEEIENVEKENNKGSALRLIQYITNKYLRKGIRLNSCYGDRYRTVTNLIFEEIIGVINNEGLCPRLCGQNFREAIQELQQN
ncbi:hypothetical protein [Wolbachia endosymbiont (group A) of Anoplius nigerrimus]|uniref:hypothetical protein n=1 Tax=Wolbachia endosymbiont (group A) of Anoplius nigerrimus TaxID=2953979 RepID=UPI0022328179|nr:hypothetical protein [Wolbachia endosymbiont (group A) of Anoplius nigerrimus]